PSITPYNRGSEVSSFTMSVILRTRSGFRKRIAPAWSASNKVKSNIFQSDLDKTSVPELPYAKARYATILRTDVEKYELGSKSKSGRSFAETVMLTGELSSGASVKVVRLKSN